MTDAPLENLALAAGYSMTNVYSIAPAVMEQLARQTPLSYEDFINQIDKDLNDIIAITESGRQHHLEKGEDGITEHMIVQLKSKYPSSFHDPQLGGHCDFYIETRSSNGNLYQWVAEAKLWEGFEYVYKGLTEQLLGSYALGGVHSCSGAMIFYSKLSSGSKYAMDKWHKGLEEKKIRIESKRSDGLRFDTSHKLNDGTGSDFYVKHYCVNLYHAPTQAKLDKAEAMIRAKMKEELLKEIEAEAKAKK
ncbi:hypothetical protein NB614_11840 [Vibrio parahaemolyticus]|uniref:hypothetical protein n=1 Tax=Vibrio parahaemolyticus TaxID=670 RepID=UPI0006B285C2|nr:hypothetical protein [Vibrio parahaemolyticus]KOY39520.1 hypothetical protein ACX08_01070 [Vibrio parahaemolyticus]MCR9875330.1 hypothetical protein [Vibrio parahaemolyticus]